MLIEEVELGYHAEESGKLNKDQHIFITPQVNTPIVSAGKGNYVFIL